MNVLAEVDGTFLCTAMQKKQKQEECFLLHALRMPATGAASE